jgi:hypothetical protein
MSLTGSARPERSEELNMMTPKKSLRHASSWGAILALLFAFVGCDGSNQSRELAIRWLDAMNGDDPSLLVRMMHPTATYADPMSRDLLTPQSLAAWLAQGWNNWTERRYTPGAIVAAPGAVVIEWRLTQTHRRGTTLTVQGATLIEHADGKVSHVRNFYNATVYLQFLKPP